MAKTKKTLEQMLAENKAVSAKVGRRVNEHTTKEAGEVKTTVAKVGKRVNDHTTKEADKTRKAVADEHVATRKKVADEHTATRKKSDDNHAATRDVVRDEAERTRRALRDYMEAPEIIIGMILGIISGIALWFAEKDVIVKPTAYDASGNVLSYGTDIFMVVVLAVVLAIFVFFVVTSLIHWIRHR